MEKRFKRKLLTTHNHFQRRFLYPVVISFFIGCGVAWLSLVYFYVLDMPGNSVKFEQFRHVIPLFLVIFCFLMFCVMLWTCYTSNKILGPYKRIIRELEETLQGTRKGPITVRKGDELFEELLKRVNILIQKI